MTQLIDLLKEIGVKDRITVFTYGRQFLEEYRHAAVLYANSHPRASMVSFNGAQAYDLYLRQWYEGRRDFQIEHLREFYKNMQVKK